jgi:Glycosyl hydrolase family 57
MNAPTASRQFETKTGTLRLFAFFHLNIAYSSIEEEQRAEVIRRCYWPLLELAEKCGPIGVEASGFTLEEIAARDPVWITELKRLIAAGRVEFIGCGYSQMIGPLVPWRVTEANLAIGNDVYKKFLGLLPTIALVNEQAYSGGLVGLYLDAGYRALIMDWDNPASTHDWPAETGYRPQRALGSDGRSIGLLWSNTVAFQKLQRFAHGDIEMDEYLSYVCGQRGDAERTLCIYASDAEIFDFRPGRYRTEEKLGGGSEWAKLEQAFDCLGSHGGCGLAAPSAILADAPTEALRLETPAVPVPVKKQPKYNLSRWAVTGRDDLAINAACESIYRSLVARKADTAAWKELCYLWASDFRTHITAKRWGALDLRLRADLLRWPIPRPQEPPKPRGDEIKDRYIDISTPCVQARLDRRRGMSLSRVAFGDHPLIGMLPHGTFDEIALQADWYTGNCVFEAPGEHKITDLEWAHASTWKNAGDTFVFARIETPKGPIEKTLRFHARSHRIDFDITFHWDDWGKGSLRLGHVTLLPDAFDWQRLSLTTHNGGKQVETFALAGETVEHGAPVSFLVSASHGLGMTEGWAEIGDDSNRIRVEVDRATAPLLGLLTHRRLRGGMFCQLALSALELDDTRKPAPFAKGPRRFRFSVNASFPSGTC